MNNNNNNNNNTNVSLIKYKSNPSPITILDDIKNSGKQQSILPQTYNENESPNKSIIVFSPKLINLTNNNGNNTKPNNGSPLISNNIDNGNSLLCQNQSICLICNRSLPPCLSSRTVSWVSILRVVFYSLKHIYPEKEYFNLKKDVYGYVATHWSLICSKKKKTSGWRKQLQDALSHCRRLFESGADHHECYGFWKLKDLSDPWEDQSNSFSTPISIVSQQSLLQNNNNTNNSNDIGSPFSSPQSPLSPIGSQSPILLHSNGDNSPKNTSNYYNYNNTLSNSGNNIINNNNSSSGNGNSVYSKIHSYPYNSYISSNSANSSPVLLNNLMKSSSTPIISSLSSSTKLFNTQNSFLPLQNSLLKSPTIYDQQNSSPSIHSSTPGSRPRSKSLHLFESPFSLSSKHYQNNLSELKFSQALVLNPKQTSYHTNQSPLLSNLSINNSPKSVPSTPFIHKKSQLSNGDLSFIREVDEMECIDSISFTKKEAMVPSQSSKLSISNLLN